MLNKLRFVVLGCKGSFVQGVLNRVSLRCGLDIHERHRRWSTPAARRATTGTSAPGARARTTLTSLAKWTTGGSVHRALLAPGQQLDALHASIPKKNSYFVSMKNFKFELWIRFYRKLNFLQKRSWKFFSYLLSFSLNLNFKLL